MNGMSAFLTVLHRELHPQERIEVRCFRPDRPNVQIFCRDAHDVARLVDQHTATYNVYVGVVPRDTVKRGSAEHCTATRVLWCEADLKTWADGPDPRAAAERAMASFAVRFGVIVSSGGGFHLYIPLAEAVDVRDPARRSRVERLNAWLGRALAGQGRASDHVQDVARILRLPETLNHKYSPAQPVTLEHCDSSTRYTLDQVEVTLRRHYPWAEASTQRASDAAAHGWLIPDAPPRDLRERAARGRIRQETLALLDATGPDRYQSPSEADAALAAGLVSAGLTADEVLALVLDSARGQDARQRKGERHTLSYWQRTVAHAAAYVGPVIAHDGRRGRLLSPPSRPAGIPLPSAIRPTGVALSEGRCDDGLTRSRIRSTS